MRIRTAKLVVAFLLLLVAMADRPASATLRVIAEPLATDEAIIVAADEYTNLSKEDWLTSSKNSAATMAEALGSMGFHVTVLNDKNATRAGIFHALTALKTKSELPIRRLLFYFAGQGTKSLNGRFAILPSDTTLDQSANIDESTEIDGSTLDRAIRAVDAQSRTVILDCAFSGGMISDSASSGEGTAPTPHKQDVWYFVSSSDTARSYSDEYGPRSEGVFTHYLAQRLKKARNADTWGAVAGDVIESVKADTEGNQIPEITKSFTGELLPQIYAEITIHSAGVNLPLAPPKDDSYSRWLPPVADQGSMSACVGWATAYYCYTATVAQQRKLTRDQIKQPNNQYSPSFIWHHFNAGDPNRGMDVYDAMQYIKTAGCATMADFPWSDKDPSSQPSDAVRARAERFTAGDTVSLYSNAYGGTSANAIKTWFIARKTPVVIGLKIYDDFMNIAHPERVYSPGAKAASVGGQALCVLGYDRKLRAFRAVNSWGADWGDRGFIWLSEDYVAKDSAEAWGMVAPGATSTGDKNIRLNGIFPAD